jgi:hypothetical protein
MTLARLSIVKPLDEVCRFIVAPLASDGYKTLGYRIIVKK